MRLLSRYGTDCPVDLHRSGASRVMMTRIDCSPTRLRHATQTAAGALLGRGAVSLVSRNHHRETHMALGSRLLLAFLLVVSLIAAPSSAKAQTNLIIKAVPIVFCPQGSGFPADGCIGAQPSGSTQVSNFFTGHTGTTYAHRPPWNVAGVDYPVGYDNGALRDPSVAGKLPTCATYAANVVTVNSAPCTLDHYDFSLHNGICVHVSPAVNSPNPITFTNDKFAFGSSCNPAGGSMLAVVNGAGEVELTVRFCEFMGDNINFNNATAIMVHAGTSGNLTVEYSAFWHTPQHDIQYNTHTGTFTVRFNYVEDLGSPGAHADWAVMISGSGAGIVTMDDQFNTLYAPRTTVGGGYLCALLAQYGGSNASCKNDTIVSQGPTVVVSYLMGINCSGTTATCNNVTFKDNWLDGSGSYGNISVVVGGSITGTKICSGNKSLLTGAAITGTFGTSPSLTCS
jgi:hypothetical protein